jgi:hypothetical protein
MQTAANPRNVISFVESKVEGQEAQEKFINRISRAWLRAIDEQKMELRPFKRDMPLNDLEFEFLNSKYGLDSETIVEKKAKNITIEQITTPPIIEKVKDEMPVKDVRPKAPIKAKADSVKWKMPPVLDCINYAEMLAATIGLGIMFNWVGIVFSLITNAFFFDSMRTVKKANSWQSAQFALFVCFVLSCVYAFVHFNTAMKSIDEAVQFDKFWVSVTAAVILSGISWAAIRQSYLKKNEEVSND